MIASIHTLFRMRLPGSQPTAPTIPRTSLPSGLVATDPPQRWKKYVQDVKKARRMLTPVERRELFLSCMAVHEKIAWKLSRRLFPQDAEHIKSRIAVWQPELARALAGNAFWSEAPFVVDAKNKQTWIAMLCVAHPLDADAAASTARLFRDLLYLRPASLRRPLHRAWLGLSSDEMATLQRAPRHVQIPRLCLAALSALSKEQIEEVADKMPRELRDGKCAAIMYAFFDGLIQAKSQLPVARLLEVILFDRHGSVLGVMQWISCLINEKKWSLLEQICQLPLDAPSEFEALRRSYQTEQVETLIELPEPIDRFAERYSETIGKFRHPDAFFIYASKLREDRTYRKPLGQFVDWVLTNRFHERRYQTRHLKIAFSDRAEAFDEWKRGEQLTVEALGFDVPKGVRHTLVLDTDDAQDLLLCGTEVGTCQKVDGEIRWNRGLIAYCLDGKYRLLVVKKSEEAAMQSRALLRLLVDEQRRPVLLLERIYPITSVRSWLGQAIIEMAVRRAQALRIPVLWSQFATSPPYPYRLRSLGGPVALEYIDVLQSLQPSGEYRIDHSWILWSPALK